MHGKLSLIAAVLLVFVTAMPAGVCCPRGAATATVMAAMPCCATHCTMAAPSQARAHEAVLAQAPQTVSAVAVCAAVTPAIAERTDAEAIRTEDSYAAPPPFLINSQFRI